MPVIRLGEMIEKIEIGDTIQIIATDPGVLHDIPAWCKVHGHKVLACDEKTDHLPQSNDGHGAEQSFNI
jgi:TusA-related sulfurtransferase